jgi:hypothetical protein
VDHSSSVVVCGQASPPGAIWWLQGPQRTFVRLLLLRGRVQGVVLIGGTGAGGRVSGCLGTGWGVGCAFLQTCQLIYRLQAVKSVHPASRLDATCQFMLACSLARTHLKHVVSRPGGDV